MNYAIGIDIGGTSLKYGIIDSTGKIIYSAKCESNAELGAVCLIDKVKNVIRETILQYKDIKIDGIGIATAGQVDNEKGQIIFATPNIPDYSGMQVKKIIESTFCINTVVENDVNAATLGEYWIGAGEGSERIIGLTIGTGIGGCIMINGNIEHGISGSAGEIGHMIINYNGLECNCGNKGCYEQYASATALVNQYKNAKALEYQNMGTIFDCNEEINAKVIFDKAKCGDILALECVEKFTYYLGIGIVSLTHIFNPQKVIIGGGISSEGQFLIRMVDKVVKAHAMSSFYNNMQVCTARLGNSAGIIGAAKMVFDKYLGDGGQDG
jgi:glucokinase